MQVDDGLAPFGRQQESAILLVVHEQILSENSRAKRVLEDEERGLNIRVAVGIVRADLLPGQVLLRSQVQTVGNVVRLRVPRKSIGTPAAGIHPLGAIPGRIDVDGKEQGFGYTVLAGNPVDPVHTLLQRDILQLGDDDLCIVPPENKPLGDGVGDFAVVAPLHQGAVGRGFTFGVDAVASVDDNFLHHNGLFLNGLRWNN